MVGLKEKKRGNQDWTCTPGRELWKRKGSLIPETSFPCWESAETDRELQGPQESEAAGLCQVGQGETSIVFSHCHITAPPTQPKRPICWCVQQLGAETQTSVGRPGERTQCGCSETAWEAWSVVWPATGGVPRTECGSTVGASGREGHGPALAVTFHPAYSGRDSTTRSSRSRVPAGSPRNGGRAELWGGGHSFSRYILWPLWVQHLRDIQADFWCSHSRGRSSRLGWCWYQVAGDITEHTSWWTQCLLSQQKHSPPTYFTSLFGTKCEGFYFTNQQADPAPKTAMTTMEQRRGPPPTFSAGSDHQQHPSQPLSRS